jgi:hypothetical protein
MFGRARAGIARGFATHVRAGDNGLAVARVGWIAGIGSRMVFAFAISHGMGLFQPIGNAK